MPFAIPSLQIVLILVIHSLLILNGYVANYVLLFDILGCKARPLECSYLKSKDLGYVIAREIEKL